MEEKILSLVRDRMVKYYPEQVKACLNVLSEEEIGWQPNHSSNSVGVLILHICGALRTYVGTKAGNIPYERNRPGEFNPGQTPARSDLLALLAETVGLLEQVFGSLSPEDLRRELPGEKRDTVGELLVRHLDHMALHTGQIIWITKSLHQDTLDELWIRAAPV